MNDEPVIITKHGKPVMAALSLETLSILCDRLSLIPEYEKAAKY
ncbi:MAG: type II toxin-antitoxin system Phd/YefM family antitoxin [Tolypothrix carrinoi HA7290-LM1]|nr:type II toxin-antitoxin system Phd/YefM family antitoxin [Tolypothrix carrinoi HA7290-LM1]